MSYKSKVSSWLVCVIVGLTAVPIIPILMIDFSWVMMITILLIICFELYFIFSIIYIVDGQTLTVKCGFLQKKRFNITKIKKIQRTNSILSSPAASLDKIAIYFFDQRTPLIISPQKRTEFINHLQRINPNIVYADH